MASEIYIRDREMLKITSVYEVLSFDSDYISVNSEHGKIEIEGEGMRILVMSHESGEMLVSGRLDGIFYAAKPHKKSLFKKETK